MFVASNYMYKLVWGESYSLFFSLQVLHKNKVRKKKEKEYQVSVYL